MSIIYIDIETLPADWTEEQKRAHVSIPKNYKDKEVIAKYIDENAVKLHTDTSFDWRYARILAIGIALDDERAPDVYYSAEGTDEGLRRMFDAILPEFKANPHAAVCGHNVAGFDLPMLWRNAVRLNHELARYLPSGRRHSGRVIDTAELWRCTDWKGSYSKLSDIAAFLGVGEKADGMDGSQVWPMWQAGRHDELIEYCRQDVALVRDIHRRLDS
jgi:predicted PolB exonuclease-like 3'-5' exonuclease